MSELTVWAGQKVSLPFQFLDYLGAAVQPTSVEVIIGNGKTTDLPSTVTHTGSTYLLTFPTSESKAKDWLVLVKGLVSDVVEWVNVWTLTVNPLPAA